MVEPIRWIEQDGSPERDNAEGVAVSSSQSRVYTTGYTFGSLTEQAKVPGSGFNVWVRLFDLNGNTLDTEQLNSESEDSSTDDFAHSIAVDSGRGPNGTIYIVGETFGDITNDTERPVNQGASDAFIVSYNPGEEQIGSPQQIGQFDIDNDGGRDFAYDVAIGSDDSVYVVGTYEAIETGTGLDAYVAKFNPNNLSSPIWIRPLRTEGTDARDEGRSITVARENGTDVIYVAGFTDGDIDNDNSNQDAETTDFWLAKLDPNNEADPIINEQEVVDGDEEARGIIASGGDIYLTGTTTGFLDSQDDPDNDPTDNLGQTDAWVSKFDGPTFNAASEPSWTEQFGSASNDLARDITISSFNNDNGTPDDDSDDFFGETRVSIIGHTEGALNGEVNRGSLDAWVVEFIDDRAEDSISSNDQSPAFTESPVFERNSFIFDPITTAATEGQTIGTVGVNDPQNDDINLAITQGNADNDGDGIEPFSISDDGIITLDDPGDLTSESSFVLTVRAIDDEDNSSEVVTIIPIDTNEPPAVGNSTFFVPLSNGPVGTINATDPENDVLTFSITGGSNQGAFAINEETGALRVVNAASIDPGESETITVTADDGTANDTGEITVNFAGTPPQFPQEKGYAYVLDPAEASNGQTVGTIAAVDLEGKTVTYSIVAGNTNDAFAINSNSGEITVNDTDQLGASFDLEVQADDGSQQSTIQVIIGSTTDDTPVLSDSSLTVDEFAADTSIGILNFVNPDPDDNDALTFNIDSGDDNDIFTIDNTTGQITVDSSNVDPGATFTLGITVNDGAATDTGTITVNFAGEAPEFSQEQGYTFEIDNPGNIANGELVGTVAATDPEGQTVTYSIQGGNTGNAFLLNPDTGALTVSDNTQLNNSFDLTIQANDGNQTETTQVIVELGNDDVPELSDSTFEVDQFATGTTVGTLNFVNPDPDANDNLDFTIIDDDNSDGIFTINDIQGQITVDSSAVTPGQTFNLTVEIDDGIETPDEGIITVNFAGETPKFVDQPPQFNPPQGFAFDVIDPAGGFANGDAVGTVEANDPEGQSITYRIAGGNPGDAFAINSETGEITIDDVDQIPAASDTFELIIEADDGNGNVVPTTAIIPINSDNDAPVLAETTLVVEDIAAETVLGSLNVADPDRDPLTFAPATVDLNGDGINNLAIDNQGVLTLTDNTGIELGNEFSFEVTVTDDGGESDTNTVNLAFRDLVELDPETGTELIGSEASDFGRSIAGDRGGNLYIAGETAGVLDSEEPPQLISLVASSADTVTLTYNKALDSVNLPQINQFTVEIDKFVDGFLAIDDLVVPIDEIVVNDRRLQIILAQQVLEAGDLVQVIYEDTNFLENDTNAIQDRFGNDAFSFNLIATNLIGIPGAGDDDPGVGIVDQEENAGRTDIWVARLGNTNPSPAQGQTESGEAPEPTQEVTVEVNSDPIFQNSSFSIDVNYQALNVDGEPVSEGVSGLGLRMHFNSQQLTFNGLTDLFQSNLNFQGEPQPDVTNSDGDTTTDQLINLSWLDSSANPDWPGDDSEAVKLFSANFTTALGINEDETNINFTSSSTAQGFVFSSTDVVIAPEQYTYDIDGNGQLDALTDGLQIIRHLFEPDDVLESAIAANPGRDFNDNGVAGEPVEDIQAYLNFSGNTNPFDVDGNGESDALTDGIMIARYMFGFRGEALTTGLLDTNNATRDLDNNGVVDSTDIQAYIESFI